MTTLLLRPGDLLEGALDTYTIAATLNRGAYGCALLARCTDGSWRVVKQFEPSETLSESDEAYQRLCFEREAQILCGFSGAAMVRGYELINRDGDLFLVMEHVQGQTLRQVLDRHRLDRGRPFELVTVLSIGAQLCDALSALHALPGQVIYRDLKPSNIMWDAQAQRLKLIDFGTARFNASGQPATQGLGTEGYAPPELYGHRQISPATDVYTLGAVLYELSTGHAPRDRQTPTDFRGYDEQLPQAFRDAVWRALAQEPAARFATPADLKTALAAVGSVPDSPPLAQRARNLHPLLACFCPECGREPAHDEALFCGYDGSPFHVALLQLVPKHRPATTVYLDRTRVVLGRNDPPNGFYPELDLTAADPARHVSRRHLTLRREQLAFSLEVHSRVNATRLGGRLLEPGTTCALTPGERLELADLVAVLLVRPVFDPPPAPLGGAS